MELKVKIKIKIKLSQLQIELSELTIQIEPAVGLESFLGEPFKDFPQKPFGKPSG